MVGGLRTLRLTLACSGLKLERAAPSRCHSGWTRPHTCGDLPPRGRKAPDRSGVRRLPLGGNRPRPSPPRSQQYRSRVVLESTRPSAIGLKGYCHRPGLLYGRESNPGYRATLEVKGPKRLADCSTDLMPQHFVQSSRHPDTSNPPPVLKRRTGASVETREVLGYYPDRP